MSQDITHLQYPVGKVAIPEQITSEMRETFIRQIEQFPSQLHKACLELKSKQLLETPYRPEGWSGRQVIHHVADSHMNALIRFKLALTEENPTIKPYKENLWAQLPDCKNLNPEVSVNIIIGVHQKLSAVLRSMNDSDFSRTYYHPESKRTFRLDQGLALYDWHCRHHLAHLHLILK